NGEGHIAKKCTVKKRVKDSEWFTDKMLLAQAQDAGVVLNEELQDFLADSLEETDNYYDNEATTNAIFMENLSPIGSLNDDTVEPRYDSDILSEVPHYENYHDSDMLNFNIQEVGYIENIVSNNESYDELTSNSNVISYTDYMLNIDEWLETASQIQRDAVTTKIKMASHDSTTASSVCCFLVMDVAFVGSLKPSFVCKSAVDMSRKTDV
ncbi:hypothetical protein Tco_0983352, partial [Tanacetum coccineum]